MSGVYLPNDMLAQDDGMMMAADAAGEPVRLARGMWTAPAPGTMDNVVRSHPLEPPTQFNAELTPAEAYAACGPAAALTFAMATGRNPTIREAVNLARTVGWNATRGMAGVGSEQALLHQMGVSAHAENGVDWGKVRQEVATGNPVIIDTPAHYYSITAYDPEADKFYVGASGTAIQGGKQWLGPSEFAGQGGGRLDTTPRSTLFLDSPHAVLPSAIAGSSPMGTSGASAIGPSGPATWNEPRDPTGVIPGGSSDMDNVKSSDDFRSWVADAPARMQAAYDASEKIWANHGSREQLADWNTEGGDNSYQAPLWDRVDSGQPSYDQGPSTTEEQPVE